jgi:hypothetical protein
MDEAACSMTTVKKKIFGDALVGLKIGRLIGLIMFLLVILRLTFDIRQG